MLNFWNGITVLLLVIFWGVTHSDNTSFNSCTKYFKYLKEDNQDFGKITLKSIPSGSLTLNVTLCYNKSFLSKNNAPFFNYEATKIRLIEYNVNKLIKYRLDFPSINKISEFPKLVKISVNDDVICTGSLCPPQSYNFTLSHTISTERGTREENKRDTITQKFLNDSKSASLSPPLIRPKRQSSRENFSLSSACGRVVQTSSFLYGGFDIYRGQYPWLVAIYKRVSDTNIQYRCEGSLLSENIVISAAHCFIDLTAQDIVVEVGRYNLNDSNEAGVIKRNVAYLRKHEDFINIPVVKADADIALLLLETPVSFTSYIRPICLWSGTDDIRDINGTHGDVAGWGEGENGELLITPRAVTATIVEEGICLRKSGYFEVTSYRTFCAGNLDDTGPCKGNSGSGLTINRNGVWEIRGIVSVGLFPKERCDLSQYVVYCDVAKHISWIQENILPPLPSVSKSATTLNSTTIACGLEGTNGQTTPLVYGGIEVNRGQYPWLVAIYKKRTSNLLYICGGTLISTRTVISAATCFLQLTAQQIIVQLGRHNLDDYSENDIEIRDLETLFIYPDFNFESSIDADIALLFLKRPVRLTANIYPICLWSGSDDVNEIAGTIGYVAGWGEKKGRPVSDVPIVARVRVVSEAECLRSALGAMSTRQRFCAGNRDGTGPCSGDSGNPLMIKRQGVWSIRGIVSSGTITENKCNRNEYVLYTDVAKYISWIQQNILN